MKSPFENSRMPLDSGCPADNILVLIDNDEVRGAVVVFQCASALIKSILFNTKFIIVNAKFISFNAKLSKRTSVTV